MSFIKNVFKSIEQGKIEAHQEQRQTEIRRDEANATADRMSAKVDRLLDQAEQIKNQGNFKGADELNKRATELYRRSLHVRK